ncbi:MAG: hypothetical protein JWP29_5423 [Rhodoferax sp.]|nr:hypothetical protein [Rhodoferax sp.]
MLLTFRYIDAKVGQNRMCNLMVAFTPETRGRYKAYFKVEPEVTGCGVSLRQEGEGEAKEVSSFHLADRVCLSGKDVGPINGRAQRLKWEVQVIRLR